MATREEKLFEAIEKFDIDKAKKLLTKKWYQKEIRSQKCFRSSIVRNLNDIAKIFIDRGVHLQYDGMEGALGFCIYNSNEEIALYMVEKGISIYKMSTGPFSGIKTPMLSLALEKNMKKLAESLIKKGADVNQADSIGKTPIYYAIASGSREMVEFIISKGASMDVTDNKHRSPKMFAKEAASEIKNYLNKIGKQQ